jgi:ABC-type multidrug transport system ATPase subunit
MRELFVDSIYKTFGHREILKDIFISCKPGEIVALLGRNGSGKSTLLKIIFGALPASQKFIKINGHVINGWHTGYKQIAYLPQNNFLPNHLAIKKIIELFCLRSSSDLLKIHEHIKPFLNKKSGDLSGGERRLIEILLILNTPADYILIDEPFNGVEPIQKNHVKKLIQYHAQDKGFIITDHDYESILDIATRTILLHEASTKKITSKIDLIDLGYIAP